MNKKLLAVLLIAAMLFSCVPMAAMADDPAAQFYGGVLRIEKASSTTVSGLGWEWYGSTLTLGKDVSQGQTPDVVTSVIFSYDIDNDVTIVLEDDIILVDAEYNRAIQMANSDSLKLTVTSTEEHTLTLQSDSRFYFEHGLTIAGNAAVIAETLERETQYIETLSVVLDTASDQSRFNIYMTEDDLNVALNNGTWNASQLNLAWDSQKLMISGTDGTLNIVDNCIAAGIIDITGGNIIINSPGEGLSGHGTINISGGNVDVNAGSNAVMGNLTVSGDAEVELTGAVRGNLVVNDGMLTVNGDIYHGVTVNDGIFNMNNGIMHWSSFNDGTETGKLIVNGGTVSISNSVIEGNYNIADSAVVTVDGKPLTGTGEGTKPNQPSEPDDETTPSTSGTSGFTGSYNYPISTPTTDNGAVELSDSNAVAGESVTITTKPDKGYGAAEVIVTDKDGNEIEVTALGNGQYTFVMPEGGVDVQVVYESAITLTVGSLYIDVFGELVKNDVSAVLTPEGRMMLPIRVIAEALGADVAWDGELQKVTITKGDTIIEIFIGADYAIVNGEKVALDSAAFIKDGRTYLPVRFISEVLNADVNWYADSKTVTIVPHNVK